MGGGLGDQSLTTVGGGTDASDLMNGKCHVISAAWFSLAGVYSDANAYLASLWPRVRAERLLTFEAGSGRLGCIGEREEQGVTLGVDLDAVVVRTSSAQKSLMGGEQYRVGLAELTKQPSRSLDVGHDKGHGSRRQRPVRRKLLIKRPAHMATRI
ncbi:hypothetical protein GCM10022236_27380 [Microlunatus ginsengisoli]|jgi:hypothetical protein|uniref:Uncharacterized protein n=1 Tax=Microlunatus ginsengisoli TaxID=363863 RepID=A0ABP7A2A1_9ACTN